MGGWGSVVEILTMNVMYTLTTLPGRNDTAFVESSSKVDNDLASPVIVNNFELSDVAVLHHHSQEPDHNLGARAQEYLKYAED